MANAKKAVQNVSKVNEYLFERFDKGLEDLKAASVAIDFDKKLTQRLLEA